MAGPNPEMSTSLGRALELIREGKTVEAEELMVDAVLEAERRHGAESPQAAEAHNELGTVLLNVQDFQGAVQAYRHACTGPMPAGGQPLKDRLTFLMNLGMALQYAGQLEQAEQVLRQGLEGRERLYGPEHAGYAFGLEPLGALLLRRGKL